MESKVSKPKKGRRKNSLTDIRHEIQRIQLILIILTTIFMSVGGAVINVNASDNAFDQNLQDTAELITRIYGFMRDAPRRDLCICMDGIAAELADVDVISIVDTENIRVYHTNHNLMGTEYDGTHPDFTTHKKGFYTESDIGPSGPQRRTYSAIYDEKGNYIGFIMAIMLKTSIRSFTYKIVLLFLSVTVAAIIIEIAICRAFSRKLKRRLLGYEPDTFSSMFRIRENILESTYDGIIAVDSENNVQFSNKAADKMLGCVDDEKITHIKQQVFAEKYLSEVLKNGTAEFGIQQETENGTALLMDCVPVMEDGILSGAVALLHDRTEYTKLMEELSGTKYLVDSMRANNHDFTNKLHVILGLIQIGEYDKAVSYIENISIIQRETLSTVMHAVDNASFAALLIGKIARASECNVRFVLKEGIRFKSSDIAVPSEALVTIAGNLIDNALDAMNMQLTDLNRQRELEFGVFTKPGELLITVRDTGCGIPDEIRDRIFEKGFSTKGTGRGVGMYHTKQLVESLGGTISFESEKDIGTSFMVLLKGNYV
ncbi:two-component system, CitB family, sensor histidine kinase DctS [Treponema bryantii]|uniref:histidine kinase n=1 Tax=Treponema bryantii TaxID=163 RepID=A0A1H9C8P2_9SPIR|nr:ATP-binding protein [Treponema bryantii]SEP97509.1 two-component system, CitB family, sensor histidine kinase DctS [Treponema bryantii]